MLFFFKLSFAFISENDTGNHSNKTGLHFFCNYTKDQVDRMNHKPSLFTFKPYVFTFVKMKRYSKIWKNYNLHKVLPKNTLKNSL